MKNFPVPRHVGSYKIVDTLGRGGMGIVYKAEHLKTGKVVALKTIRVPNPHHMTSIRREIRALMRLRHPGVVSIVDEGVDGDSPWYAMELLNGVTLRQFCAEFLWGDSDISTAWSSGGNGKSGFHPGDSEMGSSHWWTKVHGPLIEADTMDAVPESGPANEIIRDPESSSPSVTAADGDLPTVLKIVSRLCQTLAFMHGEGMIHGDLKPDNIMIRPDGTPVIMDFGLVTQIWGKESREELITESVVGGTVAYISPEQIRGEFIDARADLYSLGCILHELVTGRVPFTGRTSTEVIRAHLETDSAPPSELATDIPEVLDQLIVGLLAKHPRDRLSHANDILAVIRHLHDGDTDPDTLQEPRPYLYRSRFAGRDSEMKQLEQYLDGLETGKGHIVFLGGESGIGKTRFLMELSRTARLRKYTVLQGECIRTGSLTDETGYEASIPIQALRQPIQAIGEHCRKEGRDMTDKVLGSHGKILAMYLPMLGKLPGQDAYPDPVEIPTGAARFRLFNCLWSVFSAKSADKPVILVLDDLQWADDMTMSFLEFVLRVKELDNTPLLIIGTYRTDEVTDSLKRILGLPKPFCLTLNRLDETAIGEIVKDMLAVPESPHNFVWFLSRFANGNPFFVVEYLRTAISENVLFRNSKGQWQINEDTDETATEEDFSELPLPKALLALVERRLQILTQDAMKIVKTAAVIGREIPVLLIWHIIPFSDIMLDSLDELIRRQVLSEHQPGEYRFVHDRIREILYDGLPREESVNLHKAVAAAIEGLYGECNEDQLASLSRHWEQAGEKIKAQKYHLANARKLASQYALYDAEQAYRAYLDLVVSPSSESVTVQTELAMRVLSIQGHEQEALDVCMDALQKVESLNEPSLTAWVMLDAAKIYRGIGEISKALEMSQQAMTIFQKRQETRGEAAVLNCLGRIHCYQGRFDDAKSVYEQSANIYRTLDDEQSVGIVLGNLANIHSAQGRFKKALILFEKALEIYRKMGKKESIGIYLSNIANIYMYFDDIDRASQYYHEALWLLREIGNIHGEAMLLNNLATVYVKQGDLETAQQFLEQTLELHHDIMDQRMEGVTLGNLAVVHQRQENFDKSLECYQHALKLQREIEDKPYEAITLYNLAELTRVMTGDFTRSVSMLDEAISIFENTGNQPFIVSCLCQLGHLELAQDRSSQEFLHRISQIHEQIDWNPELEEEYRQLKLAETAWEKDEILFRGSRLADIPESLRKWLVETGQMEDH